MAKIKTTSDLILDPNNINKHSVEGMALLDKSISEVGWTEAIVVSNDNVVMSGNARSEKAVEKGFDNVILVESDGTRPVVIVRSDIKSGSKEFAKAKILANTVSRKNYIEDAEVAEAICEEFELEAVELGLVKLNGVRYSDFFIA